MDFSVYSSVVFIDSMVVLQGQPLPQQPWHEIDSVGPILVAIVPQVQHEIDKRKLDPRLSKRARLFNAMCRPCFEAGGEPVPISHGPPRVDIALMHPRRIDWGQLDLDPNEGDHVIVAQILHTEGLSSQQFRVISHDGNTIAVAARHGLPVQFLSDKWLLAPEPNPLEKKVRELESIKKSYEESHAKIDASVVINSDTPFVFMRLLEPNWNYKELYFNRLKNFNQDDLRIAMSRALGIQSQKNSFEYDRYLNDELLPHAENISRRLLKMHSQRSFSISIKNTGLVAALDLVVEIHAEGCAIDSRYVIYTAKGPKFKPKSRSLIDSIPSLYPTAKASKHEVFFEIEPENTDYAEAHCGDYRQGWSWSFDGVSTVSSSEKFSIRVRVTARNMPGDLSVHAEIPVIVQEVELEDLIDFHSCEFLRLHPLEDEIQSLLKEEKYGKLLLNPPEFDG